MGIYLYLLFAKKKTSANLGLYRRLQSEIHKSPQLRRWFNTWEDHGEPTIVVRVPNEQLMLDLQQKAESLGLPTYDIRDAGRTQVQAGSRTVCAVFGEASLVDGVTGGLKLY